MENIENKFIELSKININEYTEKVKNGAKENKYLSWAYAWSEFCKVYKNASYKIKKDEKGNCYFGNGDIGYMVYVTVNNGEGLEHEMFLPVMDSLFNVMKDKPYEYTTKYGTKQVEAIDMFYINKSVMRCMVKCIAMFGLGLYIYTGEDLPEVEVAETKKTNNEKEGVLSKTVRENEEKIKFISILNKKIIENNLETELKNIMNELKIDVLMNATIENLKYIKEKLKLI